MALDAELSEQLGHDKHEPVANVVSNARNGKSHKTLKGEFGELPIEIPRHWHGAFEPKLIPKHQTRWSGFDDKVISHFACGITIREIQTHLEVMYGADVSHSLISSITDVVSDEVKAWLARPMRFTRSCISTASTSKCVRRRCGLRRPILLSASPCRAEKRCWGSGWPRPNGPSSGCRW